MNFIALYLISLKHFTQRQYNLFHPLNYNTGWGIGILIHGYTTSTNAGGSFKLACVPDNIKEIFSKIKVDKIFLQFDTVEEALKG